jgi:hypothetical protein
VVSSRSDASSAAARCSGWQPTDPLCADTRGGAMLLATAASYVPPRQAASIDPVVTLKGND